MDFTIKRVADLVGLTPRTLRYYESLGLLPEPARTNGHYRVYSVEDIVDLLRIKRMTTLGFALHQIIDVLKDPAGEASIQALQALDAELERELGKIQAKRQAIADILNTGTALDIVPEFASALARLHDVYPASTAEELDKAQAELVAGVGNDDDIARYRALMEQRIAMVDSPEFTALRDLDARFDLVGPGSSQAELQSMIDGYITALEVVYSRLDRSLPSPFLQNIADSLHNDIYNDQQVFVMTSVMAVLRGELDKT